MYLLRRDNTVKVGQRCLEVEIGSLKVRWRLKMVFFTLKAQKIPFKEKEEDAVKAQKGAYLGVSVAPESSYGLCCGLCRDGTNCLNKAKYNGYCRWHKKIPVPALNHLCLE
ncbi:hypothetical protein HZC30_02965 [Candidatus Woesearchaeota archaeon]|nr:hypothetical protein [Candidatus Woesearchaeota archaeon]